MNNDKLMEKLDKIEARLDTIDLTLAKNTFSLEEHMKRTALLEEQFKPVKKHVELINTAAKVVSSIIGTAVIAKQLGLF